MECLQLPPARALEFSPDGRLLITGCYNIQIWDLKNRCKRNVIPHYALVHTIRFAPNQDYFLVKNNSLGILLIDSENASIMNVLSGRWAVSNHGTLFSADSQHLIEGAYDGTLSVREALSGRHILQKTIEGSISSIGYCVCLNRYVMALWRETSSGAHASICYLNDQYETVDEWPILTSRIDLIRILQDGNALLITNNRVYHIDLAKKIILTESNVDNALIRKNNILLYKKQHAIATSLDTVSIINYPTLELLGQCTFSKFILDFALAREGAREGHFLALGFNDLSVLINIDDSYIPKKLLEHFAISIFKECPPIQQILLPDAIEKMRFPTDVIAFFQAGTQFDYVPETCDAGKVLLYCSNELEISIIPIEAHYDDTERNATINNIDNIPNNSSGTYYTTAVDLTKSCEGYSPDYLLVWLPDLQIFGTYDYEHRHLKIFPHATWLDIVNNPALFINEQWGDNDEIAKDIKPWEYQMVFIPDDDDSKCQIITEQYANGWPRIVSQRSHFLNSDTR